MATVVGHRRLRIVLRARVSRATMGKAVAGGGVDVGVAGVVAITIVTARSGRKVRR
jgi:hypothetical protein